MRPSFLSSTSTPPTFPAAKQHFQRDLAGQRRLDGGVDDVCASPFPGTRRSSPGPIRRGPVLLFRRDREPCEALLRTARRRRSDHRLRPVRAAAPRRGRDRYRESLPPAMRERVRWRHSGPVANTPTDRSAASSSARASTAVARSLRCVSGLNSRCPRRLRLGRCHCRVRQFRGPPIRRRALLRPRQRSEGWRRGARRRRWVRWV